MGGEIPVSPATPAEPTVAEWQAFMTAIATANADATVSMVLQNGTDPAVADFRIPASWIVVQPRFKVDPPVVEPPPPQKTTMYVKVSMRVRDLFGTDQPQTVVNGVSISLAVGTSVEVLTTTYAATSYIWRQIASGPYAGKYIAEKTSDGATVLLSANP